MKITETDLTYFDQKLLAWCQENGWTDPRKQGGVWRAFAPNSLVEEIVPGDKVINWMLEQATHQLTPNTAIADAFKDAVEGFQGLARRLAPYIKDVAEAACEIEANSAIPDSDELSPVKKRDQRNQKLMRNFLESKCK